MSYKSILVFLDDGKSNSDRMDAAIAMAKSHGAHLTGASLQTLKPENLNSDDEKLTALEAKRMAESLVKDFREKASRAELDFDSIIIMGKSHESANQMAHHGRNTDLIILAQPNPDSRNYARMLAFAEEVMLYSGRPILFIPYIGVNKIPFKRALISWDGTPAATRATYDSIPILKRTTDATILVVQSKKQLQSKTDVQAESLSLNLERHGIHSNVELVSPGTSSVASVILNEVTHHDIDVLIMGGYGTPTLTQKILGGVTRSLLSTMLIPVLMAH
ncbi:MAG: universal stress protein [Gammaproteobacteria bacterium]|nr:universal stress protein [Gammaproteobacteria bacterium]